MNAVDDGEHTKPCPSLSRREDEDFPTDNASPMESGFAVAVPVNDEKEVFYEPLQEGHKIPPNERPDVFLIHRGPDTKDLIIRPLVHVLDEVLGVKCFADFHHTPYSIVQGVENENSFRRGLYTCNFAVMVHSDNFHTSPYPMKEYHTMIHREQQEGGCLLYPVWLSPSTNPTGAFPPHIAKRSSVVQTKSVDEFIVETALLVLRRLGRRDTSSRRIKGALRTYRWRNYKWKANKFKNAVWAFLFLLIFCVVPFGIVAMRRADSRTTPTSTETPPSHDLVPTTSPSNYIALPTTQPTALANPPPSQPGPFVTPFYSTNELYDAVDAHIAGGGAKDEVEAKYGIIEDWDVSRVTSMFRLFHAKSIVPTEYGRNPGAAGFNADISKWDVSRVTSMAEMFQGAESFNSNLSTWNVSQVVRMDSMFRDAKSFNQNLSLWEVKGLMYAEYMFYNAAEFNGNLSSWDISTVLYTTAMFHDATNFNSDLSKWNMSNVVNTAFMFNGATLFNADISQWDVSGVENMNLMFYEASSFNANISQWDVSKVTSMSLTFSFAESFNVDISQWDVSKVEDASSMFFGADLFDQNLCLWGRKLPGAQKIVFMNDMFEHTACPASISTPSFPHGPFCHVC